MSTTGVGVGVRELSLVWATPGAGKLVSVLTANEGESVSFSTPEGELQITFFSPFGDETISVSNKEIRKFQKGGIYQFKCTVNGLPRDGGVVVIKPLP
jgi:hypothetical protein